MATWLDDIITAMESLGGVARLRDLYPAVSRIREAPLSKTWHATVRRTIEAHSSDSANFGGRNVFYSVHGLGKGVWGLRNLIIKTPVAIDKKEPELPARSLCETYRILRDTKLARQIKQLHHNRCQLCGETIDLSNGEYYSEVHHIKPLGTPHNGSDGPGNIIVLCPNHHVMCDYGAIPLKLEEIKQHPNHKIKMEYVTYHNDILLKKRLSFTAT